MPLNVSLTCGAGDDLAMTQVRNRTSKEYAAWFSEFLQDKTFGRERPPKRQILVRPPTLESLRRMLLGYHAVCAALQYLCFLGALVIDR